MSVDSLMNSTGDVQEEQQEQGVTGSVTKVWKTKHSNIQMRLQPGKMIGGTRNDSTGEWTVAPFIIYINVKYHICKSNRIFIDDICYDVIRALMDSSRHQWQLQCQLIEN